MTSAKTKAACSPVPLDPPVGLVCRACGGNDLDAPCAYPGRHEHRDGCLRRERLRRDALGRAMDALADVGREFEIAGKSLEAIEAGKMAATLRNWYHAPNA